MELLGTDSHLCPQAKLAAVGELSAGIDVHRRRIDFIFASSELAADSLGAHVDTDDEREGKYSDHYPVFCTLKALDAIDPDTKKP